MAIATKDKGCRVNARLDAKRSAKLDHLKRRTGKSTSELVKRGIDLLYEDEREREPTNPLQALQDAGLVGFWEGPGDLSVRVKEEYGELLGRKHGDR